MKSQRRRIRACVFCLAVLFCSVPPAMAGPQWRVIPVELDGVENTQVADFALGADGTPWAVLIQPDQAIVYRRDGRWHRLSGTFHLSFSRSSLSDDPLHVSPTGRVYLIEYGRGRTSSGSNYGALYRLEDMDATYVTDFYHDGINRPCLFFDNQNRIWNWGTTFIAKFQDGQWERVEANVGRNPQVLEDAAGNVYFFGETLCYYRDGRFTVNAAAPAFPWERPQLKCCLWQQDMALFISPSSPGAVAIDLKTLAFSDALHSQPVSNEARMRLTLNYARNGNDSSDDASLLAIVEPYDLFSDTDGNVWLLAQRVPKVNNCFIKVHAGDGRIEIRPETASINWGHVMSNDRKSVVCTEDGTIYLSAGQDGLYLLRGDKLSHINWKQGLSINHVEWLYEHPDGTIWGASRQMGIAVYDPDGDPNQRPTSSFQTSWQEYALATRATVQDYQGGLWCCLAEQPNRISRWDGRTWKHFDQGFSLRSVRSLWVDNLQRIYILGAGGRTAPAGRRLTGTKAKDFAELTAMLIDSIQSGSRQFRGSDRWPQAPLVIGKQEIWASNGDLRRLVRYTEGTWQQIETNWSRANVFENESGQVLIGQEDRFMTFDRGQFVDFENGQTRNQKYLLSESGLQPFDSNLYKAHPIEFFPARKVNRALYVFNDLEDFQSFDPEDISDRIARLPDNFDRMWLAEGGFWSHSDNLCQLQRYYKGLLLTVDLAVTPVVGYLYSNQCNVYEDSDGDLWIQRNRTLFRVRRPELQTHIVAPKNTEWKSPKLRVEFEATANGSIEESLKYAWRLDGGPWSEPTEQTYAEVEFTMPGPHTFEVLSIGPMANIDTTPASITLNVTIPVAEVAIVSAPQSVVTDLDASFAYEITKRPADSEVTFQWRIDDGAWQETRETTARLSAMADGEHRFEVRAVTEGRYIQAPSAVARFNVKVDYEKAIRVGIQSLGASDYGQREAAAKRLVSLGQKAVPHLEEALKTASEDTQWWIRAVLAQIEDR